MGRIFEDENTRITALISLVVAVLLAGCITFGFKSCNEGAQHRHDVMVECLKTHAVLECRTLNTQQ